MTTVTTQDLSIYGKALAVLEDSQKMPQEVIDKKQAAFEKFEQLGLPSMKHEEWRHTYLGKIIRKGFIPGFIQNDESVLKNIQAKLPKVPQGKNRIVLVDGIFVKSLSTILPSDQYSITSIQESWSQNENFAIQSFASLTDQKEQALAILNTALCQDGVYISIEKNSTADIELYLVKTGGIKISMPRNLIHVKENGQVNIEEHHLILAGESFSNIVSEVILEKQAQAEWISIQDAGNNTYELDHIYVHQKEKSQYHSTTVSLTGALMRTCQYVNIAGEEAHANLGGVYLLDGEQQADNVIVIEHTAPNATSNQLFKGILDGKSTSVFNGKIMVVPEAQKTDSYQTNKNILLSEDASAYSRPQLEIYADDVKCSHGATSSDIEDSELFYLRARGIGRELSKSLLMFAFVSDVIEEIKDEKLKEWVKTRIATKLKLNL